MMPPRVAHMHAVGLALSAAEEKAEFGATERERAQAFAAVLRLRAEFTAASEALTYEERNDEF